MHEGLERCQGLGVPVTITTVLMRQNAGAMTGLVDVARHARAHLRVNVYQPWSRQIDGEGWRATFFPEVRAHSMTAAVGFAWEREPWTAVQRAAWESLRKREAE